MYLHKCTNLFYELEMHFFYANFTKKTYVNSMPYQILYEFAKQPC